MLFWNVQEEKQNIFSFSVYKHYKVNKEQNWDKWHDEESDEVNDKTNIGFSYCDDDVLSFRLVEKLSVLSTFLFRILENVNINNLWSCHWRLSQHWVYTVMIVIEKHFNIVVLHVYWPHIRVACIKSDWIKLFLLKAGGVVWNLN